MREGRDSAQFRKLLLAPLLFLRDQPCIKLRVQLRIRLCGTVRQGWGLN